MTRVLVTGAGSAAALAVVGSLRGRRVTLFLGDVDPQAPTLRLVPEARRIQLPTSTGGAYGGGLIRTCIEHRIDILIPTADVELLPIARQRRTFQIPETLLLLPEVSALEASMDRWKLHEVCGGVVDRPLTAVFGASLDPSRWRFPLLVKPRFRGDSRPARILRSMNEARSLRADPTLIVQEYLPGEEIEVDVLADAVGVPVASVARSVVSGRTHVQRRAAPMAAAERVVQALGLSFASTVRLRQARGGRLVVVDVVPRVTAGMMASRTAGVDLPWLALKAARGEALPPNASMFREVVCRSAAPEGMALQGLLGRGHLGAGLAS